MFSNLRSNSQLYILHKEATPYVEVGQVVSVTPPQPKYQSNNFMVPQELTVDIVVNVNGNNITLQKLPANLDTADQGTSSGSLFISTSREAMNVEINNQRQKSLDVINSINYHKKLSQDYELLYQKLNPEFAEQQQQKQEIDTLKAQMSEIMNNMKEMMNQFKLEGSKSK